MPTMAAALDLRFILTYVGQHFRDDTGREPWLNNGSSSNFRHQIGQGASFELYFSADDAYVLAFNERDVQSRPSLAMAS